MKLFVAFVISVVAGCNTAGPGASQTIVPTIAPSAAVATAAATPTSVATPVAIGSLPPGVLAGGTEWTATAGQFGAQQGSRFLFQCPPGGSEAVIWGTDTYTHDSSVCTAAVHVGLIGFAGGGSVVIEIRPGQASYVGSTRNGVTSQEYGDWGASFVFVAASQRPAPPTATPAGDSFQQLLTHVPVAIRESCDEVDPAAAAALAVANCNPEGLVADPAVVDDVVYVWYSTLGEATARYGQELSKIGDQPGDDCSVGPSQVAYEIDGVTHGRLLCAPDTVFGDEAVGWWYDDRLNFVGSILLATGTYEDLFNAVTAATALP